jgi:aminopeptidase N
LNKYLTDNKFKTGEAQQLRLAFEAVTGRDLNWFWNQWYYGSGHPVVKINYNYDDGTGKALVIIQQVQQGDKIFKLPIAIDVYNGAAKKRYNVWMNDKTDTFTIPYTQHPDLINVDGDKILLWQKADNKTADNYKAQIKYAPLYLDRREALSYFAKNHLPELTLGLKDKFAGLRSYTLDAIEEDSTLVNDASVLASIENIAKTDNDKKTKAKALEILAYTGDEKYKSLFEQNINDSSYSVAGAALEGLNTLDSANAYTLAKKFSGDAKGKLGEVISGVIMQNGTEADFDFILKQYKETPPGQAKFEATAAFCGYLTKVSDVSKLKQGVDEVIAFRNMIPENYRGFTDPVLKGSLEKVATAKGGEVAEYIHNALK